MLTFGHMRALPLVQKESLAAYLHSLQIPRCASQSMHVEPKMHIGMAAFAPPSCQVEMTGNSPGFELLFRGRGPCGPRATLDSFENRATLIAQSMDLPFSEAKRHDWSQKKGSMAYRVHRRHAACTTVMHRLLTLGQSEHHRLSLMQHSHPIVHWTMAVFPTMR